MVELSKSKYCGLWQCPKLAWLKKYKPEEYLMEDGVENRMAAGNVVGDLAMGLFGDFTEVTAYTDGKIDLSKMIENTKAEMEKGTENICEASFSYNGLYCAVDILRKKDDGWAIYEVKSSTKREGESKEDKPVYIADIAYQKYVLEHLGIKVTGVYLVNLNKDYIFDGKYINEKPVYDLSRLFIITDEWTAVETEEKNIAANLSIAESVLKSDVEPAIDLDIHCRNPYLCGFWKYCTKMHNIPEVSVFNLYRKKFASKIALYKDNVITLEQAEHHKKIKTKIENMQIDFFLHDREAYIDKSGIKSFLTNIRYPLYFLDFETIQPVLPLYEGTHPYQQIPFQYSLHYIESVGGELKHKEFLAESGPDPRRKIAESLCENIPLGVCTTAYNKSFECTRLKELAETFPDLSAHLLDIRDNIVDLLEPFQSGYYYNKAMGGSFSIKSVLPALFPGDPELDYHNLEGVHNGGEAMTIFPKIKDMPEDEKEKTRNNLLKYCELDTYAMVKVWQKLLDAIK